MNNSQSSNFSRESIENKWKQKGFTVEIHQGSPGTTWSSEGHETDEIFIPLEGELEVSFGGNTYNPTIGEECIIPAREPHTFKSKTASRYYWIAGYEFEEGVNGNQI